MSRLPWANRSENSAFAPFRFSLKRRLKPRLTYAMTGPIPGSSSAWKSTLSYLSRSATGRASELEQKAGRWTTVGGFSSDPPPKLVLGESRKMKILPALKKVPLASLVRECKAAEHVGEAYHLYRCKK
jgi:hypothetical protein